MTPKLIESTFNQGLGEALRQGRATWRAHPHAIHVEMTGTLQEGKSLRPDLIVTDLDIQPVIIETSFSASDADKDAQARLGCILASGGFKFLSAIALHIDPLFRSLHSAIEVTDTLLQGQLIHYALHQYVDRENQTKLRRFPMKGFVSGSIYDLIDLLRAEALPKEKIETVAEEVALRIKQSAYRVRQRIHARVIEKMTSSVHQQTHLNALHTTMVLWLNAIIVHRELYRIGHPVTATIPLEGGTELRPTKVHAAWDDILKNNWYSVFQPAVNVLSTYMAVDFQCTTDSLQLLIDSAQLIESSRVGVHMNIGAELFPKLADDRKESAAFYTQPSTAELLARLTIRETDVSEAEWGDPHFFANYSIADLACGTGTLLRAGYRTVWSFHEKYQPKPTVQESLHPDAMEKGLIGADISPIAAHLTTSSLASMDLGQTYSRTRVGWLHIGGANAVTGSLEFLKHDRATDFFDRLGGVSTGAKESDRDKSLEIHDGSVDWILMNPPYSRTRGGQSVFDVAGLSEEMRFACQKRWQTLTKNEPVNNKAGMAASFLVIAKKKIKPGGRIGFVLPLTAAFAPSWIPTREMLLNDFNDIIAIAVAGGKALGKTALSADTGMEEMLLIATRNRDNAVQPPSLTTVTLHEPVSHVGQAIEIAKSILSIPERTLSRVQWYPIKVGQDEVGQMLVHSLPSCSAPWSTLSVMSPYLAKGATKLTEGVLEWKNQKFRLPIPFTTISQLFEVGPTHHLIGHLCGNSAIGAFEMHELQEDDALVIPDLSLWHAKSNIQKQMLVSPTHKGVSVPSADHNDLEEEMRKTTSTLLYSRNMSWTSQSILAANTVHPVLGGRSWTTLQSQRHELYWAFLLWSNSTLGLITHWTQGQRTHPGRSTTQISAIKEIPCPDFSQLDEALLQSAAKVAQQLIHVQLLPACQSHCDPARKKIDLAVAEMLNIPQAARAAIEEMQTLWCREGSVHGQSKRALELLD